MTGYLCDRSIVRDLRRFVPGTSGTFAAHLRHRGSGRPSGQVRSWRRLPVGGSGQVAVDRHVVVRGGLRELDQLGPEPLGGEVPDRVVVEAELFDDRFEASAALEVELDLDRDSLRAGEDGVRQVGAVLRTGR